MFYIYIHFYLQFLNDVANIPINNLPVCVRLSH